MSWYYIVIIVVCLFMSAFFSGADMVYSTVNQNRLEKDQSKSAKLALKIAKDYDYSISIILFGNNLVNIFASSFATLLGLWLNNENFTYAETIITIVLIVVIIVFCEFLPKAFAKRYSYRLSKLFAYPVTFFKYLFFILVWPLSKLFTLFGKLFKKKAEEEEHIDEDTLQEIIDTIEEEGVIEENEAEYLRGAIELNETQAFEIMTPRVDLYAIDIEDDINELIKDEEFFKHSRVPVYEETVDNIIGILPIKAIASSILQNKPIDVRASLYEPIIVPRSRNINDLLIEFKEKGVHIALVIDEYGGLEGIVTMEDILEEIVGDIFDEQDEIEEEYVVKGHGVYILEGSMNIDDAFELIGLGDSEDEVKTDYTTIGGFCQEILERFAKKGDTFTFKHYKFTILEADEYTVEKLKVRDLEYKADN